MVDSRGFVQAKGADPRRRLGLIVALFLIAGVLLALQLLRLQVFERDRYVAWGDDQRLQTVPLEGHRGQLLDRNGEQLAVSLPRPVIAADPALVENPVIAAAALAPLLERPERELQAELASSGRFIYLARPASEDLAAEVEELALPGIFITEEPRRFRPAGDGLARGLLGLVGVDNEGVSGLELQYDETLSGTPGRLVVERSVDGRTIPNGVREAQPAQSGEDLQLTIDRALQFEVERALITHTESTGGAGGVVVITEPATGEILAMASVARTDEGDLVTTSDNKAVTWTYEPASVMKAMTFASLIDEGMATPDSTRVIPDTIQLWEDTFTDDEVYGTLPLSVTDILVRSSNTGTITWAGELGATRLHDRFAEFGIGEATNLGFPGESAGILDEVENWSGTTYATVAIGQGVAVTPLQMVSAYNVLANDGVYVAPTVLLDRSGAADEQTAPPRRVVSSETAQQVTEMLTQVVASGTAQRAAVPGYEIAAKTGTARKVQDGGGYQDSDGAYHYVATVAGYFPAESPQFSMIAIIDEPEGEYASRTAAPLFGELAAWTLRHFQVSPATDLVFRED